MKLHVTIIRHPYRQYYREEQYVADAARRLAPLLATGAFTGAVIRIDEDMKHTAWLHVAGNRVVMAREGLTFVALDPSIPEEAASITQVRAMLAEAGEFDPSAPVTSATTSTYRVFG